MAAKIRLSILIGFGLTFLVSSAVAAPTQEQKCQGRKHVAAGAYAMCRQKAQKSFVLNAREDKLGVKLGICSANFANAWDKAEEKAALAGATCPDEPLSPQAVAATVAQMTANLAGALGGASLLSCTVNSPVLSTMATRCLPEIMTGSPGPCPGIPAGQDGEVLAGVPHSYTDNGDGTITDNQTGLMWEASSADGSIHDYRNQYSWYDVFNVKLAALNASSFAGYNDWRLPNINEVRSLIHFRYPSLDPIFNAGCSAGCTQLSCNCAGSSFWTSSAQDQLNAGDGEAWAVYTFGLTYYTDVTVPNFHQTRAVRNAF